MQNPSNFKTLLINCCSETSILKLQLSQPHYRPRVSPSPDCVNIALKMPEVQTRSFRTQVIDHLGRRGLHTVSVLYSTGLVVRAAEDKSANPPFLGLVL